MEKMQVKWEGIDVDVEIYDWEYSAPCHPRWADCWGDVIGGYEIHFRAFCEDGEITNVISRNAIKKLIIKSIEEENEQP